MSDWKQILSHLATDVEAHFDRLKNGLSERLYGQDDADAHIVCYAGYGSREQIILRGRVFKNYRVSASTEQDSIWQNLLNMYRRFESDEYPHAKLVVRCGEQRWETGTDEEGFFSLTVQPANLQLAEDNTYTVQIIGEDGQVTDVMATGHLSIPAPTCTHGIISDIDDTVIHTHVTHLVKMAQITFLGNAFTRLPLRGVAAFYRALQQGTGKIGHPVFYVTNSPWNLHDLLVDFFKIQKIPRGVFFMQDFGFRKGVLLKSDHHKHDAIIHLLALYPTMNFILIGDSGEHDASIYRDIVRDYPGRILAIYIRDVDPGKSSSNRDEAVHLLSEEVQKMNVEMLLVKDTLAAAEHALAQGFIQETALAEIREEVAQSEAAGSVVELALEQITRPTQHTD